jgi:methionyl-tRNA formyltransferase
MLKVIFMGVPEFAVPALIQIHQHHQILAVYTQPDRPAGRGLKLTEPPVKKKAIELGLNVHQPERISTTEEFEKLKSFNADVFVVAAYGHLLKQNVLDLPKIGCINIHSSLLPRWRGAAPIHWAILSGDSETGVTTMRMSARLDAGNILHQEKISIDPNETTPELQDRLARIGGKLILKTLNQLELTPDWSGTVQDEASATYAPKLNKEMGWLTDQDPLIIWDRKIRALTPWPGTRVRIQLSENEFRTLSIKKATLLPENESVSETILDEENQKLIIKSKKERLELKTVQLEGKNPVSGLEFINGIQSQGYRLPLKVV